MWICGSIEHPVFNNKRSETIVISVDGRRPNTAARGSTDNDHRVDVHGNEQAQHPCAKETAVSLFGDDAVSSLRFDLVDDKISLSRLMSRRIGRHLKVLCVDDRN